MTNPYQRVKGMEDFYPAKQDVRCKVFDTLRRTAKAYGFQEIEPPAIETIKLLTAKSGEEIKKQIFILEKKGRKRLVCGLI